jgi:hypothetical protein
MDRIAAINYINTAMNSLQAALNVLNATPIGVAVYGQRDVRWASVILGTSQVTIGGYGCLMTCVASLLTDAGTDMTPDELNTWLKANGGYKNGNLFVFNSVDKLNTVKFYNIIDCAMVPAPVAQLDEFIAEGWFVAVKVDFDPKTMAVEEHWVRYLGSGQMMDPWIGDIAPIVPRYKGTDAAEAILRAAIYKKIAL